MKSMLSALPELNLGRDEVVSAPEWWARNLFVGKVRPRLFKPGFEGFAGRNDGTLCGCPCRKLTLAWPGLKIIVGLAASEFADDAVDSHLAFEQRPVKKQRRMRVGFEFPTFA